MLLTVNPDLRIICEQPLSSQPLTAISVTRGSAVPFQVQFVRNGATYDPTFTQTSGTLTIGRWYKITTFATGDSFTNLGAGSNATGQYFKATGTTPTTWTSGSTLQRCSSTGVLFGLFWAVKEEGKFDDAPLVLAASSDFTAIGSGSTVSFFAEANYITEDLNDMLGVGAADDVAEVVLMGELSWVGPEADKARKVVHQFDNSVYRGDGEIVTSPAVASTISFVTTSSESALSSSHVLTGSSTVTVTVATGLATLTIPSDVSLAGNPTTTTQTAGNNTTRLATTAFVTTAISAIPSGITIGSTAISSGTTTRVLYDNAGVLGEYAISGTGSVAMTVSPSFTTPSLGAATATTINGNAISSGTGTLALSTFTLTVTGTASLSGTHTGTSSGTNTGDNAVNSLYSGLAASKADVGQTFFLGTTSIAINRASGALSLTGITSIDGNAATATNVAVGGITGLGAGVATALAATPNATGGFVKFSGNIGAASGTSLATTGSISGASTNGTGVTGASLGGGGIGVSGTGASGVGVYGYSINGQAIYAQSDSGQLFVGYATADLENPVFTVSNAGLVSATGFDVSSVVSGSVFHVTSGGDVTGGTYNGNVIPVGNSNVLLSANNFTDLGNIAAARTNLGLGTMATQAASGVAITGGTLTNVGIGTASSLSILDGGGPTFPLQIAPVSTTGLTAPRTLTIDVNNADCTLRFTGASITTFPLGTKTLLATDGNGSALTALTPANISAGTAGISITGNAATVTTNANLTGIVTSVGNATAIADGAIALSKLATAPVTSITGTANQVIVTGTTTPTLSLPQDINSGASPTFTGANFSGLVATTITASTTAGRNVLNVTNPSAISFLKIAADNTVSTRTPAQVLSDIGAQASGSYAASGANGDITSVTALTSISPTARNSGSAAYLTITTPADTAQTASTESIGINKTAATRQWATGALATQREVVFAAPTYGFVGASTLTTAVNVDIAEPIAGTNGTLTNKYALRAQSAQIKGLASSGTSILLVTDPDFDRACELKMSGGNASLTKVGATGINYWIIGNNNTPTYLDGSTVQLRGASSTNALSATSTLVTIQVALAQSAKTTTYNGIATSGNGLAAIVKATRVTAQSAANSSIATYTAPASDGSYEVSMNMNVTAVTAMSATLNCDYTDESNTARTMILPVQSLAGNFVTGGLITGTGPYETPVMHIRVKASTAVTLYTSTGTYTGVTYTAEGIIKQTQ